MTTRLMDLTNAKNAKKDEFYTRYEDIMVEMNAYLEYNPDTFKGKTILLPCDDPEWSNFTRYFAENFDKLKLKKLISTSYADDKKTAHFEQTSLFELNSPKYDVKKTKSHGKIFTLTRDKNKNGNIDLDDLEWDYLKGDGDFRSPEVCKLRDESDIIITNPPFSLFRPFLSWIVEAGKQFLIIGNVNAVTYKEVFPLIMENKLWLGATIHSGDRKFNVPDDYPLDASNCGVDPDGKKFIRVKGVRWFTNIENMNRHTTYPLMTMEDNIKFSKHEDVRGHKYKKYDNYDAIDIPYSDAIPKDYEGVMGVPITFLDKFCVSQFSIVGQLNVGCFMDENGWQGSKGKIMTAIDGKPAYKRILIRKKTDKEPRKKK